MIPLSVPPLIVNVSSPVVPERLVIPDQPPVTAADVPRLTPVMTYEGAPANVSAVAALPVIDPAQTLPFRLIVSLPASAKTAGTAPVPAAVLIALMLTNVVSVPEAGTFSVTDVPPVTVNRSAPIDPIRVLTPVSPSTEPVIKPSVSKINKSVPVPPISEVLPEYTLTEPVTTAPIPPCTYSASPLSVSPTTPAPEASTYQNDVTKGDVNKPAGST